MHAYPVGQCTAAATVAGDTNIAARGVDFSINAVHIHPENFVVKGTSARAFDGNRAGAAFYFSGI